jgi:hypothetical protein
MSSYSPDFIQRNGSFILTLVGVMSSCFAGMMVYALKSRCTRIRFCGCAECEREPVALTPDLSVA